MNWNELICFDCIFEKPAEKKASAKQLSFARILLSDLNWFWLANCKLRISTKSIRSAFFSIQLSAGECLQSSLHLALSNAAQSKLQKGAQIQARNCKLESRFEGFRFSRELRLSQDATRFVKRWFMDEKRSFVSHFDSISTHDFDLIAQSQATRREARKPRNLRSNANYATLLWCEKAFLSLFVVVCFAAELHSMRETKQNFNSQSKQNKTEWKWKFCQFY